MSGLSLRAGISELGRRKLFWEYGEQQAMRDGPWKLLKQPINKNSEETTISLFNLDDDLGETTDLSDQEAQRVKRMSAAIDKWTKDVQLGATVQPEQ